MFILTNINPSANLVTIYDTKDSTNEEVNLYPIAQRIIAGKLRVYGLRRMNSIDANCIPLPQWGIAVSQIEAKQALAKEYMSKFNMTKQEAYIKVGLS